MADKESGGLKSVREWRKKEAEMIFAQTGRRESGE